MNFSWLNTNSIQFLRKGYIGENEDPKVRIREIAENAEKILKEEFYKFNKENFFDEVQYPPIINNFAEKFYEYMGRGWYSLSSPIWSNFGRHGLPISCNNVFVDDSLESILDKHGEISMQTKNGAGTSSFFGLIRPRGAPISTGGFSDGAVNFMSMYEAATDIVSQGTTRRGAHAVYLPVEHPDIIEFLRIREPGFPIQNLSIGVCISDGWMSDMIEGDEEKRRIWSAIIKKRYETGYPYIFFTDNVNNAKPQVYKDFNYKIWSSNLCTEVMLPSSVSESFVCDLSSMNILYYDDWKDTDAVELLTLFLDAVMSEYIKKTEYNKYMKASWSFAYRHRAIGIGWLGYHSYLQSRMFAFESMEARRLNKEIAKTIQQKSISASRQMAQWFGEPPVLRGYGMRNTTLQAIAPTTSSSFIHGQVSQGIEPYKDNYHLSDLAKGKFSFRNPYLFKYLVDEGRDNREIWQTILKNHGSVQTLPIDPEAKEVFKTFAEISPFEIILQAAERQEFIDQGQSLNLIIHPNTPPRQVSDLLIQGWGMGIKTFYYQRSMSPTQELMKDILCSSCEA